MKHLITHLQIKRILFIGLIGVLSIHLQACVALALADLVATTAVKTVGVAVDGAVGTVKLVGGALVPDKDKD